MTTLKPCPICGEQAASVFTQKDGTANIISVMCTDCYTEGPQRILKKNAIEAWNTRQREEQIRQEEREAWLAVCLPWWENKRPLSFTKEEHVKHYAVNTRGEQERALAKKCAEYVADRKDDILHHRSTLP